MLKKQYNVASEDNRRGCPEIGTQETKNPAR